MANALESSVSEQLLVDVMTQSGVPLILNNSPAGISEQILWLVKNSNLNFSAQETPFSLDIRIKKSFVTKWLNQPNDFPKQEFLSQLAAKDDLIFSLEKKVTLLQEKLENSHLNKDSNEDKRLEAVIEEKVALKEEFEKICDENAKNNEIIEILEQKLENAEKDLFNIAHKNKADMEAKLDEIKVLKSTITKTNVIFSNKTKELAEANKTIKLNEKSIYNLEQKNLNQKDTISRLKENLNDTKKEKKKLEEIFKKEEKKVKKKELVTNSGKDVSERNVFTCPFCTEYFQSQADLKTHVKADHKLISCQKCVKSFNSEEELKSHAKEIHTDLNENIEYNIETNNPFEKLEFEEVITNPEKKVKVLEINESSDKSPSEINCSNYKEYFMDFLINFKEEPMDSFKYQERAAEMMSKNHNVFHVYLRDVLKFNLCLGKFVGTQFISLDRELTGVIQGFIESLQLGVLKHGLHILLIKKSM